MFCKFSGFLICSFLLNIVFEIEKNMFFSDYFFVYSIGIFFATFSLIILLQLLFEIFTADAISKVY